MADLNENLEALSPAVVTAGLGLKVATAAINGLKKTLEFVDEGQKKALQLGQDLATVTQSSTQAMADLRGSFEDRLGAVIAAQTVGLEGNIQGMNALVNQQMILGQDYQKTTTVMAELNAVGRVQSDGLSTLGDTILRTSDRYDITTTNLVNSLDSLNSNLDTLGFRGLADDFAGLTTTLTGQFGAQFQGQLGKVIELFGGTGTQGLESLAILGITDIREQLAAAAGDSEEMQRIALRAIQTAGNTFSDMTSKNSIELGAMNEATKGLGVTFAALANQIDEGLNDPDEDLNAQIGGIFDLIKREFVAPIKQFVALNSGPIQDAILAVSNYIKTSFLPAVLDFTTLLVQTFEIGAGLIRMSFDPLGGGMQVRDTLFGDDSQIVKSLKEMRSGYEKNLEIAEKNLEANKTTADALVEDTLPALAGISQDILSKTVDTILGFTGTAPDERLTDVVNLLELIEQKDGPVFNYPDTVVPMGD